MRGPYFFRNPSWIVLAAALSAAGMWLYTQRVLVAYQIAHAAVRGTPRGNLSDLYPRWIGARELLLQGHDPYSPEVTRDSQAGYYGRPLDPSLPGDPKDQQGFAYPVYVVFLLAPTVRLPFQTVQRAFSWLLLGLTIATIPLWLRVLRMRLPLWAQASVLGFMLGSLALMQGLKLQQMSLLVAALIAAALALLVGECPIPAGILLALATIKPQLVLLLLLWLGIWTAADWRRRYRWFASFLVTMVVLIAASEWWLPHWISRFWHALGEYQRYTGAVPVLDELIPAPWGRLFELPALVATAVIGWRCRGQSEQTSSFATTVGLVLAVTVFVIPTYAPYNQLLLLPALLWLARDGNAILGRSLAGRGLGVIVAVLVAWPWFSSTILAGLSFLLPAHLIQRAWAVPGWTALFIPVAVAALMLVYCYYAAFPAAERQPTA